MIKIGMQSEEQKEKKRSNQLKSEGWRQKFVCAR